MPEDSFSASSLKQGEAVKQGEAGKLGESGGDTSLQPVPAWMGMAKFAVIGMGIIFVAGFVLVAGTIVTRLSSSKPVIPSASDGTFAGRFGVSDIHMAPGDEVRGVTLEGQRIAIHIGGDKGEEIIIVSAVTGMEIGRIRLRPLADFARR